MDFEMISKMISKSEVVFKTISGTKSKMISTRYFQTISKMIPKWICKMISKTVSTTIYTMIFTRLFKNKFTDRKLLS